MLKDIHWVSMYRNVYNVRLWRTTRFCFYSFCFLYLSLPLSSDVSHTNTNLLTFLFGLLVFSRAQGLCILTKCAVCKFVLLYEWAFVFVHLLHRTSWRILRDTNTETKSKKWKKKKKKSREGNDTQRYKGVAISELVQEHATKIHSLKNQIINHTKTFWESKWLHWHGNKELWRWFGDDGLRCWLNDNIEQIAVL